jgi:hypothetical protein
MAKGLRQVNLRINEGRCWVAAVQRVQEDSPSKERTACRKETQLETLGKAHYDRKKKNERQQETQGKHKELYKTVMDHI